jgi:hypothetical protein
VANRYVRIHDKPEGFGEPATLIGFSMSATPDDKGYDAFESYFAESERTMRSVTYAGDDGELLQALGGVSPYYLEVQPPLRDEQLASLGHLCAQHVDTGNNYGYLIDNRDTPPPLRPFDLRGKLIARW